MNFKKLIVFIITIISVESWSVFPKESSPLLCTDLDSEKDLLVRLTEKYAVHLCDACPKLPFEKMPNTTLIGTSFETIKSVSYYDCVNSCYLNKKCLVLSYDHSNMACQFFDSTLNSSLEARNNCTTLLIDQPMVVYSNMVYIKDTIIKGTLISSVESESLRECFDLCSSNPACSSFMFEDQTCKTFSYLNGIGLKYGAVSMVSLHLTSQEFDDDLGINKFNCTIEELGKSVNRESISKSENFLTNCFRHSEGSNFQLVSIKPTQPFTLNRKKRNFFANVFTSLAEEVWKTVEKTSTSAFKLITFRPKEAFEDFKAIPVVETTVNAVAATGKLVENMSKGKWDETGKNLLDITMGAVQLIPGGKVCGTIVRSSLDDVAESLIKTAVKSGDNIVNNAVKQVDNVVENTLKRSDDLVQNLAKNGDNILDDAVNSGIRQGDEIAEKSFRKNDDLAESGRQGVVDKGKKVDDDVADSKSKLDKHQNKDKEKNGKNYCKYDKKGKRSTKKKDCIDVCPNIIIENALEHNCNDVEENHECDLLCLPGYVESDTKPKCSNNGNWFKKPNCKPQSCGLQFGLSNLKLPVRINEFGLMEKTAFFVSYDTKRMLPKYSIQSFALFSRIKSIKRNDKKWKKYLKKFYSHPCQIPQLTDSDYRGTGYDRGHLTPSNIMSFTIREKLSTNLYINIAPQDRYTNQHPWKNIESKTNSFLSSNFKSSYIITGVCGGTLEIKGRLHVPSCFWKLICFIENTRTMVVGFYADNSKVNLIEMIKRRDQVNELRSQEFIQSKLGSYVDLSDAWKDAENQNKNIFGQTQGFPSGYDCANSIKLSDDITTIWNRRGPEDLNNDQNQQMEIDDDVDDLNDAMDTGL